MLYPLHINTYNNQEQRWHKRSGPIQFRFRLCHATTNPSNFKKKTKQPADVSKQRKPPHSKLLQSDVHEDSKLPAKLLCKIPLVHKMHYLLALPKRFLGAQARK